MPNRLYDTSGVVKHYRLEIGTAKVDSLLAEVGSLHFISALSVVELHSSLARAVRIGEINRTTFNSLSGKFFADVASSTWQVLPINAGHYDHARSLVTKHGLRRQLRTLDAIQLAVALLEPSLDAFVCADTALCVIAAAEGLTVINPEIP